MKFPRFDPDGQCLNVALDFVFSYFDDTQLPQDIVNLSGSYKTIFRFLVKNGYHFVISIPLGSLFFVNFWAMFFQFFGHFIFSKKYVYIKSQLTNTNKKYIVLGEDTAKKLYGLRGEYWSHFVVFYHDTEKNTLKKFDPLKSLLEEEMGRQIEEYRDDDKLLLKLLIWRNDTL
jgi:hypothetical protein